MLQDTLKSQDWEISGEVQGDIRVPAGATLTIGDGGCVHGSVHVEAGGRAEIEGEVQGNLYAEGSVNVTDAAVIHGSIYGVAQGG